MILNLVLNVFSDNNFRGGLLLFHAVIYWFTDAQNQSNGGSFFRVSSQAYFPLK